MESVAGTPGLVDSGEDTEILSSTSDEDESELSFMSTPKTTSNKWASPAVQVVNSTSGGDQADQPEALTLKVRRAIIKNVFGKHLSREESVEVLKKKFSVKSNDLTCMTPTQLLAVLIRKLVSGGYVQIDGNDFKVVKEISLM